MSFALNRRAVIAGLSATPLAAQAQAARPVLRLGVQSSAQSLEPPREFSHVSWRIGYNLFEGLLRVDYRDNFALKPALATAWQRQSPTIGVSTSTLACAVKP